MGLDLILLTVVCIFNLLLGMLVLLRNRHARYSVYFFFITIFVSAWAFTNYLTNIHLSYGLSVFTNQAAYLSAIMATVFATLFTYEFPHKRVMIRREKLIILFTIIPAGLSMTRYVAGDVIYRATENPTFTSGPLLFVYAASFVAMFVLLARNLLHSLHSTKSVIREQSALMLLGFSVTAIVGFLLNVIIPTIAQDWHTTRYGPVLSLTLVATVSYAIVRHRLFDIRSVVVRYVGYLLAVIFLATVFGFSVAAVTKILFNLQLPLATQMFFVAATGLVGLLFQPIKALFDSLTKHIFYQDSYDPQLLFNQLNKVLVSSLDVNYLLQHSATTIARHIKPEYCMIGLADSAGNYRLFGDAPTGVDASLGAKLRAAMHGSRGDVIVADYIDANKSELKELMTANNIAVVVQLNQRVHRVRSSLGFIVLGVKRSGHSYGEQDIQTMQNVANELIIAIQNALHYEEIQQFNAVLQAKVDEATRKLRNTNEKLKALDEAKDDFVSMASHQLRTPLTSIKGYTSMVLEGDAGKINATQRQLLEQSYASSQRMVYLIADLLNVSRLKTGKFMIDARPVNIAEIVRQEIGQLKEVAASRSLELTYDAPTEFPSLMLDETKTRQVIMNFIDNAIYYTPSGGHIAVQVTESASSVSFKVVDDGIGVPKLEQPHLFTKFYRAGNARTARPDGTGLGLFMGKKVVVAQGGALIFDTEEGVGSTFGFMFNKTKLAVPDAT